MLPKKIKTHELWKHIGAIIRLEGEYGLTGVYIVLSRDSFGINIGHFHSYETELLEQYTEDEEVMVIDLKVDIDKLVIFKLKQLVNLIDDGFSLTGSGMDLGPYIREFHGLVMAQNINNISNNK